MQRFTKTRAVKLPTRAMLTLATLIGLLLNIVAPALPGVQTPTASAHNLNASAVYVYFDPDTQTFLDARINGGWTPGTPLLQAGDELGLIIKAVPDLGTNTGVGGYTTFYVPNGLQVLDAAFVQPGSNPADGISGYDKIPAKGQALMPAVGAGGGPTVSLVGITRGPNTLGVTSPIVTSANVNLGTLPGVYGDIGIFYSTAPETAFGTYTGAAQSLKNNSGDIVGLRTRLQNPLNLWDAWQLAAYGINGTTNPSYPSSPLIDSNGRGYAPWGLANVVAGPQSGYAWEFDFAKYTTCDPTPTTSPLANCIDQATQDVGPWQRIKYPGSQISDDPPGANPAVQPYTRGAGASNVGFDLTTGDLPPTVSQTDSTSPKAIRWAYGQLTYLQPEFAWVKVKVLDYNAILDPSGCPIWNVDTFGGDAGGDSGGKDHIWRYYDPNSLVFNGCIAVGKPATRDFVKVGDTYQYKIKFYNAGNIALSNVVVKDTLPSGVTFISAAPAQNSGPNPLIWNVGSMLPGQKFETTVTVKATSSGALVNSLTVTGDPPTGPPLTVTVNEETIAGNIAFLVQSKSVTPSSVAPGGTVQYTIYVNNLGTGVTGSPVQISEYLPAGFTYVSKDSVLVNGADVTAATTVNASNPNRPIFSVPTGINASQSMALTFTAQVGANVVAGSYCNSFTTTQNSTPLTTGSQACVAVGGGRIGDTIFRDWYSNGIQDPGEEGLAGVTVQLNGGATTVTDANGYYEFNGLTAGNYTVDVIGGIPAGYTLTTANDPMSVTLAENEQRLNVDFGYHPGGVGAIGDQVFKDIGNDGLFNGADSGIANVTVNLYEDTNGNGVIDAGQDLLIATTTTNGSGLYSFSGLDPARTYIVKVDETDPDLAAAFSPNTFVSSTANPHLVTPADFTAQSNNVTNADFGYFENLPSTIGDQVFIDANNNGVFDVGVDSPIAGATVQIYLDGVFLKSDTTDASGNYLFEQLAAGDYTIKVVLDATIPGGYAPTVAQYAIALPSSTTVLTADFPFVPLISKSVDKATANPGEILTYQINVHYPGGDLLSNVIITDSMPTGTTYADNASPAPAVQPTVGATGVISWSLGSNTPARDGSVIPAVTLLASQDTYIDQAKPNNTFGADTTLSINGGVSTSKLMRPLIQFDLSSVCPGAIQSAELILVRPDGGGNADAQPVTVHRVTQSWNAATATWTSFGAAGFATAGSDPTQTVTGNSGDIPYTWNVTDIVKSWCQIASPNANNGFILTSALDSNKSHLFYSMEGALGLTPRLKINGGSPEFAAPVHVTNSLGGNDALKPAVLYDGNGVAHVVFSGKSATDSKVNIYYSNDQGTGTWTTPVRINPAEPPFGAADALYPRLTVDGSNNLYVAFETKGANDSKVNVYAVKGTKGAGNTWTWGTAANVSNDLGGQDSLTPDIGVDSTGIAHVVFSGKNGSSKINIYYSRRDSGTGIWTAPVKITQNPPFDISDALHPRIAVGPGDSLHIAFQTKAAGDSKINIYYMKGTKSGAIWTFGSAQNVSHDLGGQDSLLPDIDTDSAGAAHIVFQGKSAANGDNRINIYYVTNSSGSFSTPKKASLEPPFDAQDSLLPQITVGADNKLHVTFQGQTSFDSKKNVYYTTISNGVIGTATNISKDLGNQDALAPDVAVSGSYALVLFQGKDGSKIDIFASRSPLAAALANLNNHLQASPTLVGNGDTITVIQTLTADTADSNLTPGALSVTGANGANATCGAATLISTDNNLNGTAGDAVVYRWTCTASAGANPGNVVFKATASGSSLVFAQGASNSVLVAPTLTFKVTVGNPATVSIVKNTASIRDESVIPPTPSNIAQTALGASIGDRVWADLNGNGIQDAGEPGLGGVQVIVNGPGCSPCTAVTDGLGNYLIAGLAAGSYTVTYNPATAPVGYAATTPSSLNVTLTAGQQITTADFGLRPPGTSSIGDTVWLDANENGIVDAGESGLPNVTVRLYNSTGATLLATTTTDANGNYTFSGLHAASYQVQVDASSPVTSPFGVVSTIGAAMDLVSGTNPHQVVNLLDNQTYTSADFGYNWGGSIGDYAWYDNNGNQLQDGGELPAPGATTVLYYDLNGDGVYQSGEPILAVDETDAAGAYLFDNLPPGNYVVEVSEQEVPAPPSSPNAGQIGVMVATTGTQVGLALAPNQDVTTVDWGFIESGLLEGHLFHDVNHNGVLDAGEPLLSGVTVTLTGVDTNNNPVSETTTTNAAGEYDFIVPPGDYTITYNAGDIPSALSEPTTATSISLSVGAGAEVTGLDFGVDNSGRVGDTVFLDANSSGSQDGGESGLSGVTVELYNSAGTTLLATSATDSTGKYEFLGLADGNYVVKVLPTTAPSGYSATTPTQYTATVSSGGSDLDNDFGFVPPGPTYTIGGRVYDDQNNNGNDDAEPALAGVEVTVVCDSGAFVTVTDANGDWSVSGVEAGSVCNPLTVDPATLPNSAYVGTETPTTPITVNGNTTGLDFGFNQQLGAISGTVCVGGGDGICQPGEAPLNNVDVTLRYAGVDGFLNTADDVVNTVQTAPDGSYSFANLLPGLYQIVETNPAGYVSLADRDGLNPDNITVALAVGQSITGRDFEDAAPLLLIDKDATTTSVLPGGQATYRIVLRNSGNVAATGVTVTDTLPAGFTYATSSVVQSLATRTSASNPTVGATTPVWGVWTIQPSGAITVNLTVNVGGGVSTGVYDNTASASATNHPTVVDDGAVAQDPNTPPGQDPVNDDDVTVLPAATPSYAVSKILNTPEPARTGDTISFTIRITNTGSIAITELPLRDLYDVRYLVFESATPAPVDPTDDGQLDWNDLTATFGQDLAPNASFSVVVYFNAWHDTTLLGGSATTNSANGHDVLADPDGPGGVAPIPVPDPLPASDTVQVFGPTAVTLEALSASYDGVRVIIAWQTASEVEALAFNILRQDETGVWTTLNSELIPAQKAGQSTGAAYQFVDETVHTQAQYRYVLEIIPNDGDSAYSEIGTVFTGGQVYLPLIGQP